MRLLFLEHWKRHKEERGKPVILRGTGKLWVNGMLIATSDSFTEISEVDK